MKDNNDKETRVKVRIHNISGNNKMKCEIRSTTESNLITKYERCICNKINRNYNNR